MKKELKIGIFDSGVGGLTVCKAIRSSLSSEDIVYLGDTARVPYGAKSRETVLKYTIQNSLFLLDCGVKALVIACNTASAYGLSAIQNYFKVPVLGVITPGASAAVLKTKNKKIGVIGTEGTIKSYAYQQAILSLDPSQDITAVACPLLVPLAEEGWQKGEVVQKVLWHYLEGIMKVGVDTLILGCTHYPLFKEVLKTLLGDSVFLVDSALETANLLQKTLKNLDLLNDEERKGTTSFFSTDSPERMQRIGRLFLGSDIGDVQKVEIL